MATNHIWTSNESKVDTEEKLDNNHCIVVVGTTGVGKSSLIKLFCGNNVITSSSTASCTKGCTIFNDKTSPQKWMDTQGTDDNEMKDEDGVILKNIFKKLYDQNISHIKLIWIVSGDMDRGRAEYRKQAKFISSFVDDRNRLDQIWKCCLIIHKRGKLQPSLKSLKGVIAVTREFGANYQFGTNKRKQQKHLFGYTCIDWMDDDDKDDDDTLRMISKLPSPQQTSEMLNCGYLDSQKLQKIVSERLDNLPSMELEYLHEKCTKCGVEGDHRFIAAKCHTEKTLIHTGIIENYHPEYLHYIHPSSTYQEPSITYSSRTDYYHPGDVRFIDLIVWSRTYHDCCDRDEGSRGCKSNTVSIPHTTYNIKYRCCGSSAGSSGCTQVHSCCNGNHSSTGCGRRYRCCQRNENSIGCTWACALCKQEWGQSNGCTVTNFMCD